MELTCLERLVCRGQGAAGPFQESVGELHAVSVGTESPRPALLSSLLRGVDWGWAPVRPSLRTGRDPARALGWARGCPSRALTSGGV